MAASLSAVPDEPLLFQHPQRDAHRIERLRFTKRVRNFPRPTLPHRIEGVDDLSFAFAERFRSGQLIAYLKEFFQFVSLDRDRVAVNTVDI